MVDATNTYVPKWNFGTLSNNTITDDDGVVHNSTALKKYAAELDPELVMANLAAGGDALRYEVGNTKLTAAQIQAGVDSGRFTVGDGGYIYDNGVKIDTNKVGFELQTAVISKLHKDVAELNDLLSMLTILDGWAQDAIADDDSDQAVWTSLRHSNGSDDEGFQAYIGAKDATYDGSPKTAEAFYVEANNAYVNWMVSNPQAAPTPVSEAERVKRRDPTNPFRELDPVKPNLQFGTHTMTESVSNYVLTYAIDFSDASERVRNLVKEKSTQAEQLSTDFQTRNSRFNAMMEAMSNYAQTYFDALQSLIK